MRMTPNTTYPKIQEVKPREHKILWVKFDNGVSKVYDCAPLLQSEPFRRLADETVFRLAHADSNGYAVVWTDEIDLAESEIWIKGKDVEQDSPTDGAARHR